MPNIPEHFYFHGNEAEPFIHIQIPILLVKEKVFSCLSGDAIILYGLLLNRVGLSVSNNWFDENGRTYICYTIESVAKEMHYSERKANRLFKELTDINDTGYGLIEKVRVLNKPSRIYVFNFMAVYHTLLGLNKCDDSEKIHEENTDKALEILDTTNMASRTRQIWHENYNNNINNNNINNNLSIPPVKDVEGMEGEMPKTENNYPYEDFADGVLYPLSKLEDYFPYTDLRSMLTYRHFADECEFFSLSQSERKERAIDELKWLIDYKSFEQAHLHEIKLVDAMLDYMSDIVALDEKIVFKDITYHADMMGKRFFELDYQAVEYVLEAISNSSQTVKIRDIRKYYIKCLLTARSNMNTGINSQVAYDMANWHE